jgi:hypothetical protein
VADIPFPIPEEFRAMEQLYRLEWVQHHFQVYNIEALDIVQLPRYPEDLLAFQKALNFDGSAQTGRKLGRRWELTNTRYMLGPAKFLWALNNQIDPGRQRFRIVDTYDIATKPNSPPVAHLDNLTAKLTPNGKYAVFEFTGALPRVKLYANWQVNTNKPETLERLADPVFDPERELIVAGGPTSSMPAGAFQEAGTAQITSYSPKDLSIKAEARVECTLLLNDRFDPNWIARVDGKPAEILRCNYLMRGIHLDPGSHTIEFKFVPPIGPLYVSLAGLFVAVAVAGVVFVDHRRRFAPVKTVPPQARQKPVAVTAIPNQDSIPKPKAPVPAKRPAQKARK